MVLVIYKILEDRLAGNTNLWIDAHSGDFLLYIKKVLNWSAQDTLGIAGILLVGTFLLFIVLSYFQKADSREQNLISHNRSLKTKTSASIQKEFQDRNKVPITMEFNPESTNYFLQEDREGSNGQSERYREYHCNVYNHDDVSLRNVTCEVEQLVTIPNRPDDVQIAPQTLHEKLAFDLPEFPTRTDLAPKERVKVWLFSRLRKAPDNEPIRILKRSTNFYDQGRQREVKIRVTADNYDERRFTTTVWVKDGILRMIGLRPEN